MAGYDPGRSKQHSILLLKLTESALDFVLHYQRALGNASALGGLFFLQKLCKTYRTQTRQTPVFSISRLLRA